MKLLLGAAAALALLGAVLLPRVRELQRYHAESAAHGRLGLLKLAVPDAKKRDGRWPAALPEAPELWRAQLAALPHPPTAAVTASASARDGGGWGYDAASGRVFIDCTHLDSRLKSWSEY